MELEVETQEAKLAECNWHGSRQLWCENHMGEWYENHGGYIT